MVPLDVVGVRRGAAIYPAIAAAGAAVEPRLEAWAGRDALSYPLPIAFGPDAEAPPAPLSATPAGLRFVIPTSAG